MRGLERAVYRRCAIVNEADMAAVSLHLAARSSRYPASLWKPSAMA